MRASAWQAGRARRARPARRARVAIVLFAAALATAGAGFLLGGCGEKIAVPQAQGLFGVNAYYADTSFAAPGVDQITVINNLLYVVGGGELSKRDLDFQVIKTVGGLAGPVALCRDESGGTILVWEQDAGRLSAFAASDLSLRGQTELPAVHRAVAMAVCGTGVATAAGARTFLYLSDPDSGVVHRYAVFTEDFDDLRPWGILARSDGAAARFVHVAGGLAVDPTGHLLVCDADTLRNWVIRFDPTPDLADTVRGPAPDPLRGLAVPFGAPLCNPPTAADCTLGDAAGCDGAEWVGGPSAEPGEFYAPRDVILGGNGKVFVADTGNGRIQVFKADYGYDIVFGSAALLPRPVSIGLVDARVGAGADDVNYGAYVFALSRAAGVVQRFISAQQYEDLNGRPYIGG